MRIEIEIPKEFENDYKVDMFKDFFSRVLCDIEKGKCLCGNYEKEAAEMFLKAFDESRIAFDTEKVVEQLEEIRKTALNKVKLPIMIVCKHDLQEFADICFEESIDIVKKGGVE